MSQIRKNRFSLWSRERAGNAPEDIQTGRLQLESENDKKNKYKPLIIISSVAAVAIIAALVTTLVYKKPGIFSPGKKKAATEESIFSGSDRKILPEGKTENLHLIRGKESYRKGYFADALAEFTEVVESDASDEDKAMALTYMGIIYDDQGDYGKAIDHYTRALKYDRRNPVIYRNLSIAYMHRKDYEKAAEYAEMAAEHDTGNANNRILLGNVRFNQADYKGAIREYQKALEISPENPAAMFNLAMSLLKTGDEVAAVDYLKRAGAADSMGEVASLAYGKLGVIFTARKDFEQAEKYLSLAISIRPTDPVNRYNLGIVYLKLGKPDKALEEFKKAEDLGRQDPAILENLGEAYFSLREYDRSIDTYNRLLETNRRNVKILSRMAEIYYEKGELDRAYEYYHKITTLEPASENARMAYLNMGNILDDAQRFDEAIESYNRALAISPKDDATLYNLGIAYKHAGKPELAIESWKKAADLNRDSPQPLMALADFYYEHRDYDMAMDEYQRVLRRWPNIQEGHFNLATIYYKKNLNEYAIEEYKRVIELDDRNDLARKAFINLGILTARAEKPDDATIQKSMGYVQKALLLKPGDAEALLSLGIMYSRKEMYEKAIDTFYQAIRATTDQKFLAEAYNNIGKCYYKKEQYKKALQAFTRGIEEDPTNEEIRMNRKTAMQAYEEELAGR